MTGADFTQTMLAVAARRHGMRRLHAWVTADAHRLPFRDGSFDVVTNAFVLRNLVDLPGALREMRRVLRPGGLAVCLDMTAPPGGLFSRAYRLYFSRVMPPIAGALAGDRAAYRYLPASLEGFPDADAVAAMLRSAGFEDVEYRRMAGGAVALHAGRAA